MPTEISGSTGVNKIQDGTVAQADFASNVGGKIIKQTVYKNSTRTALSNSADTTIFTTNFTKLKSNTESYIHVTTSIVCHDAASDFCGLYCDLQTNSNHATNDSSAFHGVGHDQHGAQKFIHINKVFDDRADLDAGTHTLEIGWRTRNGASVDKPTTIINPNSSDDARAHQTGFHLFINEVLV